MTYNGCHEPAFVSSDRPPTLALQRPDRFRRSLDLLVFAAPVSVLPRSIRTALMSVRDLRLADSLGGGVADRGKAGSERVHSWSRWCGSGKFVFRWSPRWQDANDVPAKYASQSFMSRGRRLNRFDRASAASTLSCTPMRQRRSDNLAGDRHFVGCPVAAARREPCAACQKRSEPEPVAVHVRQRYVATAFGAAAQTALGARASPSPPSGAGSSARLGRSEPSQAATGQCRIRDRSRPPLAEHFRHGLPRWYDWLMESRDRDSLVAQLQREVVNSSVPISDILRKAKVLASLLPNGEFKDWVDGGLYRKVPIHLDRG